MAGLFVPLSITANAETDGIYTISNGEVHTITFKVDGQIYAEISVADGEAIGNQLPETPVVQGYSFKGWKNLAGIIVTDETVVTCDMVVVAQLAEMHTVIFKVNGQVYAEIGVTAGETIGNALPEDPIIPDETFKGWRDLAGNFVTQETIVTESMTAEAYFGEKYTVTYRVDGKMYAQVQVTDGEIIGSRQPVAPVMSGYVFKGWKDMAGTPVTDETVITCDMVVVADFAEIYVVTFKVNGLVYARIQVADGEIIGDAMPEEPIIPDETFKGWRDLAGNFVTQETIVTESMTVEAYVGEKFTVTYKVNGQIYAEVQVTEGKRIGNQMPVSPIVSGYNFIGWKDLAGTPVTDETVVTYDMIVVAELEKIHTITFKVNEQVYAQIRVADGEMIGSQLPVSPVIPGYFFHGWKDLAGNAVSSTTVVTEDMVVVAEIEDMQFIKRNVTFTVNGQVYAEIQVRDGEMIGSQLPTSPVVTGYTFVGWRDLMGNHVTEETIITSDITVIAKLEEFHEHEYGEWTVEDDNNHKKICLCGDAVTEVHGWNDGVMTLEPTYETEGAKLYTCTECGHTKTETLDKLVPEYKLGDPNGDGAIDVKDVIAIRRFIAGGYNIAIAGKAADVNKDGKVDIKDGIVIRRYIAGGYDVEI